MRNFFYLLTLVGGIFLCSCSPSKETKETQPVYQDTPFLQEYSTKYYFKSDSVKPQKVGCDRNGDVKILTSMGLYKPYDGQFLYPGTVEKDRSYRPMGAKKLADMVVYKDQFVYLDDKAVLSNSWAGKIYSGHALSDASLFEAGKDFSFLVSNGKEVKFIQDATVAWSGTISDDKILSVRYDSSRNLFWLLGSKGLSVFNPEKKGLKPAFKGENLTCFDLSGDRKLIYIGTTNGYIKFDPAPEVLKQVGEVVQRVPSTNITALREVNGQMWFGSTEGAFQLREDGKYNFYNGERWLPGNLVVDFAKGVDNDVLILTDKGLAELSYKNWTLADKADYYGKQVRLRHIRNGFNASFDNMEKGNIASGRLSDSDNDGLWTSMYLAGEVFRYAVTRSEDALQNCRESLDAMERLYTINGLKGFPSRSFERSGWMPYLSDPDRWQKSPDPEWDWKSTTSSDEAIGHIFVLGAMAELIGDTDLKNRSVHLIDILMQHIVDHDMYLVDFDGKPTLWGKWNPDYVNAIPRNVGDRKINSSNIIAMLQTAYHFTHKEVFKEKAFELMNKYGYYENLMQLMDNIGKAGPDADEHSKMLSGEWNHSDDEMYFVGYWGLYRYAFNDTLKAKFKDAIIDHWQIERPEKEGAWNIFTALTGTPEFDLNEAAWWLREHPVDLIDWVIINSNRNDIDKIEPNFRNQTLKEVLPPDERPVSRHNGNMFNLDRTHGNGNSEHSAGDIWLLPYWMGRYLGVISEPKK
ncbi:MAG TPA: hypothetical protein VN249_13345 [Prolixibacteraceae bacterium]|nr:hypothetical protein [Prolixibacteraceae bacterium]